jgi:hypothetical protein
VATDPGVRQEAHGVLQGLFSHIGSQGQQGGNTPALGGLSGQLEEFLTMPMDMAQIFLNMSVQLTELVLNSLEEAGITLVKGLTPA